MSMEKQTAIAIGAAVGSALWGGLSALLIPYFLVMPEGNDVILVGIWSAAGGVVGVCAVMIAGHGPVKGE